MNDRTKQYLQAMREDAISAAEAKLGRPLLPQEKAGIDNLHSGMRLESCYISFSHATTTPEAVVADLAHFTSLIGQEPSEPAV